MSDTPATITIEQERELDARLLRYRMVMQWTLEHLRRGDASAARSLLEDFHVRKPSRAWAR